MISVILFFIGASLLLYVVMGGADYGAGILELLPMPRLMTSLKQEQRHVINRAMGPVWEANHIWLILIVVILFTGFPQIFNVIMVHLHLPLVALLVGIVVRGTAFTFRHYDAIHDKKSQDTYSLFFGLSSLWTAFWLGVIASSLQRGLINTEAKDFWTAYVAPWWGFFPFAMGLFVVAIFSFLASIYLVGETSDLVLKQILRRRAFVANILVVLLGAVVFVASYFEATDLAFKFLHNPLALTAMILATLLFAVLWLFVKTARPLLGRLVAAGQMALILFGWYALYAPDALQTVQGPVSFYQAAAPAATLLQLVVALCVGSLLIFPSLYFLLRVFKIGKLQN